MKGATADDVAEGAPEETGSICFEPRNLPPNVAHTGRGGALGVRWGGILGSHIQTHKAGCLHREIWFRSDNHACSIVLCCAVPVAYV